MENSNKLKSKWKIIRTAVAKYLNKLKYEVLNNFLNIEKYEENLASLVQKFYQLKLLDDKIEHNLENDSVRVFISIENFVALSNIQ